MSSGCGAPQQGGAEQAETDQIVLSGTIRAAGDPVDGAHVRLLDDSGEFTAEVVSSAAGQFRFYAAPGDWTVRALHRSGRGQAEVSAAGAGVHEVDVAVA